MVDHEASLDAILEASLNASLESEIEFWDAIRSPKSLETAMKSVRNEDYKFSIPRHVLEDKKLLDLVVLEEFALREYVVDCDLSHEARAPVKAATTIGDVRAIAESCLENDVALQVYPEALLSCVPRGYGVSDAVFLCASKSSFPIKRVYQAVNILRSTVEADRQKAELNSDDSAWGDWQTLRALDFGLRTGVFPANMIWDFRVIAVLGSHPKLARRAAEVIGVFYLDVEHSASPNVVLAAGGRALMERAESADAPADRGTAKAYLWITMRVWGLDSCQFASAILLSTKVSYSITEEVLVEWACSRLA